MYINPFLAGILVTIMAEILIIICAAIETTRRKK